MSIVAITINLFGTSEQYEVENFVHEHKSGSYVHHQVLGYDPNFPIYQISSEHPVERIVRLFKPFYAKMQGRDIVPSVVILEVKEDGVHGHLSEFAPGSEQKSLNILCQEKEAPLIEVFFLLTGRKDENQMNELFKHLHQELNL